MSKAEMTPKDFLSFIFKGTSAKDVLVGAALALGSLAIPLVIIYLLVVYGGLK